MHEIMRPLGYVMEEEYEQDRPERVMPDFLREHEQYLLRYRQANNPTPFFATDYIVCVHGVVEHRKFSEIKFEPVSPDAEKLPRALGSISTDNFGIIFSRSKYARLKRERGYFLDRAEPLFLTFENYALQDEGAYH